jgi:membrane protein DedA with SNARE-associated domain
MNGLPLRHLATHRITIETLCWTIVTARLVTLPFLPSVAAHPPLGIVIARPTGGVLMLAAANAGPARLIAIAMCAIMSRAVLDIATFTLFYLHGPAIVHRALTASGDRFLARLHRPAATRFLVALCVVYSSTPVVAAAGLVRLRPRTFIIASGIGSTLVVSAYLTAALLLHSTLTQAAGWIVEYRWWLTPVLAMLVIWLLIRQVRRTAAQRSHPQE